MHTYAYLSEKPIHKEAKMFNNFSKQEELF